MAIAVSRKVQRRFRDSALTDADSAGIRGGGVPASAIDIVTVAFDALEASVVPKDHDGLGRARWRPGRGRLVPTRQWIGLGVDSHGDLDVAVADAPGREGPSLDECVGQVVRRAESVGGDRYCLFPKERKQFKPAGLGDRIRVHREIRAAVGH
jgi:hypothetical protein